MKKNRKKVFHSKPLPVKNTLEAVPLNKNPGNWFIWVVSAILVLLLGFAVYYGSISGKFIWDDKLLVSENVYIKNGANITQFFTKDIGTGAGKTYGFYRPILMLTYMADYSLGKLDPSYYHVTNILLHILVTLCICWLINILFGDWLLALLTSLLFVVHPVHTEAVAWISGRADLLSILFMLLAFICYIKRFRFEILAVVLVSLSYLLAVLSKESSLILPVLLVLYHFVFKQKIRVGKFLPVLAITVVYSVLRLTVLKFPTAAATNTTILQRMPGFFVAITNYVAALILPFDLHMEHGNMLFRLFDPKAMAGILIAAALLSYAFMKKNTNALVSFSILWFFVTLLPVSNLYPINYYMTEHWLYLPSIGFFLVIANGLSRLYRRKAWRTISIVIAIGILASYFYLTIKQIDSYWKEPVKFYEQTLKYSPNNVKMYNELAGIYYGSGRREEAIALLKKAVSINPKYDYSYNNLGIIYNSMKNPGEAILWFNQAIEMNPGDWEAYYNLGTLYGARGDTEKAITFFRKTIEVNPSYPSAYTNLGMEYSKIGKHPEAIRSFQKAIELNPFDVNIQNKLGNAYTSAGQYDEAIIAYEKAVEIAPGFALGHSNLAVLYYHNKRYDLAIDHCDQALRLGYHMDSKFLKLLEPYR